MTEFLHNFHFLRPWYLLLLVLPLWLYFKYIGGIGNKSSWESVVDKKLLNFMLIRGSGRSRKHLSFLICAGFLSAVIGIAGPAWEKRPSPALAPDNPVIILFNLSSDMAEKDLEPDRLTRAKYKISDLLNELKTIQAGLMVYTSEPFLITPLTDDASIVKNLLQNIVFDIMPTNGDRLDRAIDLAVQRLKAARYSKGNIIVFAADVGMAFDRVIQSAEKAKAAGYTIHTIAVTSFKNDKLAMTAEKGGGIYANIQAGDEDIKNIVSSINNSISAELKQSKNMQNSYIDFGYYLVFLPLLACLFLFRRGIVALVFWLSFAPCAQAGFFLNHNQEGLAAFNKGDYAAAAASFDLPAWKGSAYYRLGSYQKAYREFSKNSDITSLYNQGNALAKAGKIKEAITKYEEVLKQDESHADARFNLEYLKQQQQNQNQKQDEQKQQEEQQQEQPQGQNQQEQQKEEQSQKQEENQEQKEDQKQSDEQNQQDKKGEQEQQEQQEPQPRPSQENQEKQEEQPQEGQQNQQQEQQPQPAGQEEEKDEPEQQPQGAVAKQDEEDNQEYDESAQAREMLYREIPEDPGGLLRAFINKEYSKNRYKDSR